jgi:BirA family biotin operon repressor/biotin-[acetyl-CoA-carboxylase] ligase
LTSDNLFIGHNRVHLADVDSTNNYARTLVRDKMPIEGTVVTTDKQTNGRGQRTNLWVTEPNMNLTCSYILRPAFLAAKDQFLLSASVALAVFDLISDVVTDESVKIKWPNDILVGEKKIAGILIENSLRGSNLDNSIVGIGLNVNQTEFPNEINGTSIKKTLGRDTDIEAVLLQLNSRLEKHYLQLRQGQNQAILSQFNQRLFAFEEERILKVNGDENRYMIRGVRPSGELQLQNQNGTNSLHQHHEIEWNLKS